MQINFPEMNSEYEKDYVLEVLRHFYTTLSTSMQDGTKSQKIDQTTSTINLMYFLVNLKL